MRRLHGARRVIVLGLALSIGVSSGQVLPIEGESMKESRIGERFHHETAHSRKGALVELLRSKPPKPPRYKVYAGAKRIDLPLPDHRGLPVETAIKKRRSVRNYSPDSLSLGALSQLLFAAQGTTGRLHGEPLRSAPSAGALYPFELYVIANNVAGLSEGLYHYGPKEHELELVRAGDLSDEITEAALEQAMFGEADVTFVLAAVFDRTRYKYGERGFRYVYIEAGHISQNIYLQAVSLGLGSVAVGAFLDETLNALIGVDGTSEAAIYLHAVGTR